MTPLLDTPALWDWNPVANTIQFGSMLIGTGLIIFWLFDASRLYHAFRSAAAPSALPTGR